jgi:hypothetical protein
VETQGAHLGRPEVEGGFGDSDHLHLDAIGELEVKLTVANALEVEAIKSGPGYI